MSILKSTIYSVLMVAIVLQIMVNVYEPNLKYEFHGRVENGFEKVIEIFKNNYENGFDREGSTFAVCHNGKTVVNIWGGYADSKAGVLWQKDTLTNMFSVTKSITALSLAVLVDRGLLGYSDLVTKFWPEFGKNGKENATIKMLINHELGLVALDESVTFESIRNWKTMSSILENQKPQWPPGTATGYHTLTIGWLVDQVIRRVDPKKRSLGQFFKQEIAEPYDIDLHIGLPVELNHRLARLIGPTFKDILSYVFDFDVWRLAYKVYGQKSGESLWKRSTQNPKWRNEYTGFNMFNHPEMHPLEIGAANGKGTAEAVAKLFCLLNSEKLIKKSTLEHLLKPVWINVVEKTMNINVTWGWGFYHTKNPDGNYQIGHPGYGGQYVKYDNQHKLSFAYLRNHLTYTGPSLQSKSFVALETAVYEAIQKIA